jgi:hypothetical protein
MFWSSNRVVEELEMVISIDAIQPGIGLEPAANWHPLHAEEPAEEWEGGFTLGRGVVYGLLLSCLLWAGLIVGIRTLVSLLA